MEPYIHTLGMIALGTFSFGFFLIISGFHYPKFIEISGFVFIVAIMHFLSFICNYSLFVEMSNPEPYILDANPSICLPITPLAPQNVGEFV